MNRGLSVLALAGWAAAVSAAGPAPLPSPTAKQAVALANAKVDAAIRDHVILLEGKDSDSSLRPRVWEVTYYDHQRWQGGTVVRVKDGAAVSVGPSVRLFDDARVKRFGRNFTGYDKEEIMDVGRWVMDSDKVVAAALAHPRLAGLQVTAVMLRLAKPSDGAVPPQWRVSLRARAAANPTRERWVGHLYYNAETAELVAELLNVDPLRR